MWNLALEPLKTLYLRYYNAYRHQSGQDGDLLERLYPQSPWPFDHVISQDHVTNKNHIHFHSAYGHQSGHDVDLPRGTPTRKLTWPFDHVILRNYVRNQKLHIHYHGAYDHQTWQWIDYNTTLLAPIILRSHQGEFIRIHHRMR